MRRTSWRPLPRGELTAMETVVFAGAVGGFGLWLLAHFVNELKCDQVVMGRRKGVRRKTIG